MAIEDLEEAPENGARSRREGDPRPGHGGRDGRRTEGGDHYSRPAQALAADVRRGGQDTKWQRLSNLLGEIFTPAGLGRRIDDPPAPYGAGTIPKPIPSPRPEAGFLFTEHRDTLAHLAASDRLASRPAAVDRLDTRRHGTRSGARPGKILHDPEVQVLLATDAAGEGINLQRAHLMVNYDLPWNPVGSEQRFGRIHRIGQTEVFAIYGILWLKETFAEGMSTGGSLESSKSAPGVGQTSV